DKRTSMSEREDDFLSRWSRRKDNARSGGLRKKSEPVHKPGRMRTDAPEPEQAEAVAEADADAEAPLAREAALQDEHAPAPAQEKAAKEPEPEPEPEEDAKPGEFDDFDFDKLNYGSDYTQFMKNGVPEAVRRRALRMLWSSNPILANIDGLNDYDEDFTDAALAVKVLTSNYKPGLGHLTEEERNASYSEEARKAGEQPVEDDPDDLDVEDMDAEDMDEGESPDDAEIASATPESDEDGENGKAPGEDGTA
ncbi:MAG: DUF3306 domain-containing protein, partial [Methyloligellaceae bacterium]